MAIIVTFFVLQGCVATIFPQRDTSDKILAAQRECADHFGIDHTFTNSVPGSTVLEGENKDNQTWDFAVVCRDGFEVNNL